MYGTTPSTTPVATGGDTITVKITFIDGSQIELRSMVQMGEEYTSATKIGDLLHASILTFDVDGRTMLFPVQSIRYIEISPALKTPHLLIQSGFTLAR